MIETLNIISKSVGELRKRKLLFAIQEMEEFEGLEELPKAEPAAKEADPARVYTAASAAG